MSIWAVSMNVALRRVFVVVGVAVLGVTLATSGARAQEMYAGIQARIPNIVLMTNLLGPFGTAESCETARIMAYENMRAECAVCVFEYNKCFSSSNLAGIYRQAIDKASIGFPYVVTSVSRTIFSEGSRAVLVEMCEAAAADVRKNLDSGATCVKPPG